ISSAAVFLSLRSFPTRRSSDLFLAGFAIILVLGVACWFPTRRIHKELRTRDGFFITVLIWTVLCLAGAIPLFLSEQPSLPLADRSEEHTSELQSRENLVCRLLL